MYYILCSIYSVITGNMNVQCTLSIDEYYFTEQFIPGPDGIQPHNFVIKNNEDLLMKSLSYPTKESNFDWLNHSLYNVENEIYDLSVGANIVINTNKADLRLILLNKYNSNDEGDIDYLYFIPFSERAEPTLMLDLSNFGNNDV